MASASLPEPHRRETYDGLDLASDPVDRLTAADFVVGVGPAPVLLARLTIRKSIRAALDLGTGPGTQALLAARHAERVVGVDINPRALAYAAENARLNGIDNVEWRLGSWLEPVAGERFDLIVANPPFVISPDADLVYRDSGEPRDALVRRLLGLIPRHLEEGGFAQVLCDWLPWDGDWRAPVEAAVAGAGCDVVVLRYDEVDPAVYARRWNRPLRDRDQRAFEAVVERWCTHYREQGIRAIASGVVALHRRSGRRNWARGFEVPAGPTEGAGEHLERLFTGRERLLAGGATRPATGARLVRRVSLADGSERISFEVRPNVGFAAPVSAETARALLGDGVAPAEERRLVSLGLLVPA